MSNADRGEGRGGRRERQTDELNEPVLLAVDEREHERLPRARAGWAEHREEAGVGERVGDERPPALERAGDEGDEPEERERKGVGADWAAGGQGPSDEVREAYRAGRGVEGGTDVVLDLRAGTTMCVLTMLAAASTRSSVTRNRRRLGMTSSATKRAI